MAREMKTAEGLTHIRWVWEHQLDWIHHVMRTSDNSKGYKYCLVPSKYSSRLFSLRTNMKLTQRLANRLYSRPFTTAIGKYFANRETEEEWQPGKPVMRRTKGKPVMHRTKWEDRRKNGSNRETLDGEVSKRDAAYAP